MGVAAVSDEQWFRHCGLRIATRAVRSGCWMLDVGCWLKPSLQLMNRRVVNLACRIAETSGTGVKQFSTAALCAISAISGFSDHRLHLARVCPSGARLCAADTSAVMD